MYVVRKMTAVETKDGERVILNNDNVNAVAENVTKKRMQELVDAGNVVELDVEDAADATPLRAEAELRAEEAAPAKKSNTKKGE